MNINQEHPHPLDAARQAANREQAIRRLTNADGHRGDAMELLTFMADRGSKGTWQTITYDDIVMLREALIESQVATDAFYDLWKLARGITD